MLLLHCSPLMVRRAGLMHPGNARERTLKALLFSPSDCLIPPGSEPDGLRRGRARSGVGVVLSASGCYLALIRPCQQAAASLFPEVFTASPGHPPQKRLNDTTIIISMACVASLFHLPATPYPLTVSLTVNSRCQLLSRIPRLIEFPSNGSDSSTRGVTGVMVETAGTRAA